MVSAPLGSCLSRHHLLLDEVARGMHCHKVSQLELVARFEENCLSDYHSRTARRHLLRRSRCVTRARPHHLTVVLDDVAIIMPVRR
jgi:hypothetical protein